MGVQWIDPHQKRSIQLRGVSLTKTLLRIGYDERQALGDPAYVRVGIDQAAGVLVIAPGDAESGASLRRYKGARSSQIQSRNVLRAIRDQLGWEAGERLACTVSGKTLEIRRSERQRPSARKGRMSAALGIGSVEQQAYGTGVG